MNWSILKMIWYICSLGVGIAYASETVSLATWMIAGATLGFANELVSIFFSCFYFSNDFQQLRKLSEVAFKTRNLVIVRLLETPQISANAFTNSEVSTGRRA